MQPHDVQIIPGALSCLFDVRQQQFLRIRYTADPKENEQVVAQQLVDDLLPGCLILADLGYFGYAWFDALSQRGQFWISRVRAGTRIVHPYYDAHGVFDGLSAWGPPGLITSALPSVSSGFPGRTDPSSP